MLGRMEREERTRDEEREKRRLQRKLAERGTVLPTVILCGRLRSLFLCIWEVEREILLQRHWWDSEVLHVSLSESYA